MVEVGLCAVFGSWGGKAETRYRLNTSVHALGRAPGAEIVAVVLGLNLLGDALTNALQPKV